MQAWCLRVTDHEWFRRTVVMLLVINAVTLGLETSRTLSPDAHVALALIDHTILMILVVEVGMRILAHGLIFFRSAWNIFDFLVTIIALIPFSGSFAAIRTLRVLRILRLFSYIPRLRQVINAVVESIPGIFSILIVMLLIFYVFAIIAVNMLGERFPEWFGSIGASMFTLFQIMTLENWASEIARTVLKVYPHAWIFFVAFILLTTFTILNLFIALLVSEMHVENMRKRAGDPEGIDTARLRRKRI